MAYFRQVFRLEHRWEHRYLAPKDLLVGIVLWFKGDKGAAKQSLESIMGVLRSDLDKNPQNVRNRCAVGLACAGASRAEEAVLEGERAVHDLPLHVDAVGGAPAVFDLILIYIMVGKHDAALDLVERLLEHPCDEFSAVTMRIDKS